MDTIEGIALPPAVPSKYDIDLGPYEQIPLTQGKHALVSPEDYTYLSRFKWHAREDGRTFYAYRRRPRNEEGTEFISMHRLIAESLGMLDNEHPEVDHFNRDGLDNRRSNLRGATRSQNASNRKARGFSYDHRLHKKPYVVRTGGKHGRYVGTFATEEEAVAAYLQEKERVSQL